MHVDPTGHFALATFGIAALLAITLGSAIIGGGAQLVSNYVAGERGSELWRGVVGSALGTGVNALVLCLTIKMGPTSLIIAAGAGALVQTSVDLIETAIRGEKINWRQTALDLVINFAVTWVGNYMGGNLIPTNNGWFKPQKFWSVFIRPYGQRILMQTLIGAVISGSINFARKYEWKYNNPNKPFIVSPVMPLIPFWRN